MQSYVNAVRDGDDHARSNGGIHTKMRANGSGDSNCSHLFSPSHEDSVEHEQGSEQHQHDTSAESIGASSLTLSLSLSSTLGSLSGVALSASHPSEAPLSSNLDDVESSLLSSSTSNDSSLNKSHESTDAMPSDGGNRLVRTGEHTYRIPDGEKCTVKVGDKIRIIHGPAILNFASSDGLMTSVMGDVPKISASTAASCNIPTARGAKPTTTYEIRDKASLLVPSLSSSPSKSDHAEEEEGVIEGELRVFTEEGNDKRDHKRRASDLSERAPDGSPSGMGDYNPWKRGKTKEEASDNGNDSGLFICEPDSRDQHHQTNSEEEVIILGDSKQHSSSGDTSCMLHVDTRHNHASNGTTRRTGSRQVSPCSEKSHDSSYSSRGSPGPHSPTSDHHRHCSSMSSPLCDDSGIVSNGALSATGGSRRAKRKVKLVPYQEPTGADYVERVKTALSSVGAPRVVEIEATRAKVIWDSCNPTTFPPNSLTSSGGSIVDRVVYVISWGEKETNKRTQITCGNVCNCLLEPLSPLHDYEVSLQATVDEVRGHYSALISFTSKGLPPDRPSPPVLKTAARNSLVVGWQPPNSDNGSKITTYKLFAVHESKQLDLSGLDVWKVTMAPAAGSATGGPDGNSYVEGVVGVDERLKYEGCQRSAKLDHLQPNTEYRLRLVACNKHGSSVPSSEVILRTLPVQPPQPDPPSLVYRDTHTIRLNWSVYLNKHLKTLARQHIDFTLQMEDQQNKQHGFITKYCGPDTCYTLTNLPRSSSFAFKLFAETAASSVRSVSSEVATFCTLNSVPRAPTGLKCVDVTSNKCSLEWEKPSDDGGSAVVEYIVERSISGGLFQEIYHGDDVTLPISSLFPGMEYHFRVAAVNSVGKGKFSTSCLCYTHPVIPNQCNPPVVNGRIKPQNVHLSWTPPDYDGGSPIMQYAVKQIANLDKPETGVEISRDFSFEVLVCELNPGSVYGFSVCAINSVGAGPWSVPAKIRTASDKPSAPEPPRVVFKSATHAKVSWTVPKHSNGSKITEYRLEGCETKRTSSSHVKFEVCSAITGSKSPLSEEVAAAASLSNLHMSSASSSSNKATGGTGEGHQSMNYRNHASTSRYGAAYGGAKEDNTRQRHSAATAASKNNNNNQNSNSNNNGGNSPTFYLLYNGTKLSFDYTNMKPATKYAFRVQAVNEIGASVFSKETEIESPISQPNIVEKIFADKGADWISVRWHEPECNGAQILSYNIECARLKSSYYASSSSSGAASSLSLHSPKRTIPVVIGDKNQLQFPDEKVAHIHRYMCEDTCFTMRNLKSDCEYFVRVQATNERGDSEFSTPISVHTLSVPPDPPQLECVNATSSSLKLRWTDLSNSCSKDLKYHLQMEDKAARFVTTFSGAAVSYKVIKLQEQTSYTFRINASNDAGSGPFSSLYSFTTTKSPPPPIKAPKMRVCRESNCAEVSWVAVVSSYTEDKVLYQLMVAFAPNSTEFLQAYKGEETFLDMDQIVMLATSRGATIAANSGKNSNGSVLDMRLKVCAIRHSVEDDQMIYGQYSPMSSFLYSLDNHNNTSANGVSSTNSGGSSSVVARSGLASLSLRSSSGSTSNSSNRRDRDNANWIELDQSDSYTGNGNNSSIQVTATGASSNNEKRKSKSNNGSISVSYSEGKACETDESSRECGMFLRALCVARTSIREFQPTDKQIAVMVLTVFVLLVALLTLYVQHMFV
ncbi:fibronectin type-III domain-containing protein 3A-like isoform X2 [Symsagittifera roscoffensis]|uniref:fibronectin type-III domain-containing protein 3A-like isoform X2 n=1 Tax=Symsagittifera roscoffensis TaxID=84072 RepID=UPI00307CA567